LNFPNSDSPSTGGVDIRADEVSMTFRSGGGALTVFSGISVEIAAGERVAIVGESGAGKSTFLYILGGLDRPTRGAVYYGSQNIFGLDEPGRAVFRNRTLGFVWQMNSLLPEFTALENVAMPLLAAGVPPAKAELTARDRLHEVGLSARESHRPGALSGGEQQRVALARALVNSPKALLADEPTGNLDYRTGESVAGLLEELQRVHRFTTIVVTHNLVFAKRFDRILQLDKGAFVPVGADSIPGSEAAPGASLRGSRG
jgi:lipoprotein-releasing system ATP-binding protein